MSLFLKKFETETAYTAAESSLILPNVSYIVETNGVAYKPYVPPTPHDYVEIGDVKWATMNVGAESITDAGLYFQWGDTSGYTASQVGSGSEQKYFGWADYKYSNNGGSSVSDMTKYNSTDGKTVLDASDDAVTAAWGGKWRMPTTAEFVALGAATTSAWTQVNGVYGLQCTDKTDSSKVLFFPAAGGCYDGSVSYVGSSGYYWSSSLYTSNMTSACYLYFYSSSVDWQDYDNRRYGRCVRGVLAENS